MGDTIALIAERGVAHEISCAAYAADTVAAADEAVGLTSRVETIRRWLAGRPAPATSAKTLTSAEVDTRRQELRQLVAAGPADHTLIIDRLSAGGLDTSEIQQQLDTAIRHQGERRTWILEHWPHLVELEQLDKLVTSQRDRPSPMAVPAGEEHLRG